MKTTKHTPGPWSVASYEAGKVVIEAHDGSDVAELIWCDKPGIVEMCKADAALIAAAPDLLAACKEAIAELTNARGGYPSWNATPGRVQCALNLLRAAIARAEGGAK